MTNNLNYAMFLCSLKIFSSHQMDKLKVTLPKFSIRGSLELNEPLASLNISKLFGPGEDHDGGGGNDADDDGWWS